jgi:hypothetical protein
MKQKYFKLMFITVILIVTGCSEALYGGIIKTSFKSTAIVGSQYIYDVNVFPLGDSAFFLDKKLLGMEINASTGLITWTPTNIDQGGQVTVRVTVGGFTESQSFIVYISDAVVCDANMVSYWKLDETTGSTFADFKSGYNALTGVAPEVINGIVDNGQKFDPARDIRLSVADVADQYGWMTGDDISGAVWFKSAVDITSETGPQVIMGRMGTSGSTTNRHWWWFGLDTNNYVTVELTNNVGTLTEGDVGYPNLLTNHSPAGVHYSDDQWHFAVFTLEGNTSNQYTLKIYVDGILAQASNATKTFLPGNFTSNAELNIGWWQNPWSLDFEFDGSMDEAAIYSRALLPDEILEMYNDGIAATAYCQPVNYAPIFESEPDTAAIQDIQYTYDIIVSDYDTIDLPIITKIEAPGWLTSFTDNGDGTAKLMGTPSNSDVGNNTVILRVSDTKVEVDQTYTISVSNVNDKPVFTSTAITNVAEDAVYIYSIITQDIDAGSSLTISAVSTLPSWLTLTDNGNGTGTLTGTPLNADVGTVNVTLKVTDNLATFNEQTFTIIVINVNDPPLITGQSALSINEDENIVLSLNDLTVTDVDNNYPADFGLEVLSGDHYTFSGTTITPDVDWNGLLSVNIALSDLSSTVNGTVLIEVETVNDLPVFTSTPVTAASVNTAYEYWVSATDVEDPELTFEVVTKPSWATFTYNSTVNLGLLQGTPAANAASTANVSIKVTDSNGGTALQDFVIIVAGVTSIDDINAADAVKVYPTPVKDYAYVEVGTNFGKGTLQILTLSGAVIKEFVTNNQSVIKVDLSDLRPGHYICRLIGAEKQAIIKIIKE